MNVGYVEKRLVASSGSCKLYAFYEANHYFHRCSDGRIWNEKSAFMIDKYVMKNSENGEEHELVAMVEGPDGKIKVISDRHRVLAHWEGFSGDSNKTYRMPNRSFRKRYYGEY